VITDVEVVVQHTFPAHPAPAPFKYTGII
jgi:hypothetical protein